MSGLFPLPLSSKDFGRLRKFSDIIGNLQVCLCESSKSRHSQDKNLTPNTQKKLAGIKYQQGSMNNSEDITIKS